MYQSYKNIFFISFSWNDMRQEFVFLRYMLMRTYVGYLFFVVFFSVFRLWVFLFWRKNLSQKLSFPCCIFIVSENFHWFCNVWFFAIKIDQLASANDQCKINSSVTMERYLNILEAPRQQKKETSDEEIIKYKNLLKATAVFHKLLEMQIKKMSKNIFDIFFFYVRHVYILH